MITKDQRSDRLFFEGSYNTKLPGRWPYDFRGLP